MNYFKKILIAGDQVVNAVLGGWPDETLSSRLHRKAHNYVEDLNTRKPRILPQKFWQVVERAVDCVFFWDKKVIKVNYNDERVEDRTVRHCYLSYRSEIDDRQLHPMMRGKK